MHNNSSPPPPRIVHFSDIVEEFGRVRQHAFGMWVPTGDTVGMWNTYCFSQQQLFRERV
jgi:hypothetical protein